MVAAVALVVSLAAGGARAQSPEEPSVDAGATDPKISTQEKIEQLVQGGDGFVKKAERLERGGRPAEAKDQYLRALSAFELAHQLSPSPALLLSRAMVEQALERWVEAATHYRGFLKEAVSAPAEVRADAERRFEIVKLSLGVLTLTIDPDGSQVAIDATTVGTSPLTEPIFVLPGQYVLTITSDGYQPLEQKLVIEAGSESERTFELEPVQVYVQPLPAPEPEVVLPPPDPPSKAVMGVTAGIAVAAASAAVVTGIWAINKSDTAHDDAVTEAERDDARDVGKRLALTTDLLLAGAGVAAVATAYYYRNVYQPRWRAYVQRQREYRESASGGGGRSRRRGVAVTMTPWLQPQAGGLAITGLLW